MYMSSASVDTPLAPRFFYGEQNNNRPVQRNDGTAAQARYYGNGHYPLNSSLDSPNLVSPTQADYSHSDFPNGIKVENFGPVSHSGVDPQTSGEISISLHTKPPSLPNVWSHSSDSSSVPSAGLHTPFLDGPRDLFHGQDRSGSQWVEPVEHHFPLRKPSQASPSACRMPSSGNAQEVVNNQINSHNLHQGLPAKTAWQVEPEEDYYDMESDDEDSSMKPQICNTASYDLGPVIALSASKDDMGMRSMTGFLNEPNVLANYEPPYTVNPLMDPRTARVFCHFITATAPTLAVCERHPSNPPIIFSGVPVPKSQRALWTYTLPMKALKHQGLLHAMLALASLHISKLQGTSPMPSLKHYHYALKRISKSLVNQKKKRDVATLAATLLLGYYEVTTAEHNKWNSHLSGARQLIMDIDFAGMQRRIESHRNRQEANIRQHMIHNGNGYEMLYAPGLSDDIPPRYERQLDENLISTLRGRHLRYNQYAQIGDEEEFSSPSDGSPPPTSYEIENFEIQSDLFWCSPITATYQENPSAYGYMPNPGLQGIRLPKGFDQARHERLYTEPLSNEETSLEIATREAEAEWLAIRDAYDIWLEAVGPDYAPLEPEHMTPTATPFGPALYYRSYAIACVLSLYHCGRIICERIHPSMPPAAQSACGMAAPRTAGYANTIGRICAGIQPLDSTVSINPHHGAALMDSCMSLFHAGIQYRDPAQRGWTITKLRDVARLTGWQTSALIAHGCEQAWIKTYEAGRGPRYERTTNMMAKDDRVAGRGRDPVSLSQPPKDNNDRRFIFRNPGTRVYWALGILGADEDMKNMYLE
ncbi:hypothetical protein P7C71_g2834, partial [Lecanoromycetidae sp. Uapishka_2]